MIFFCFEFLADRIEHQLLLILVGLTDFLDEIFPHNSKSLFILSPERQKADFAGGIAEN